MSGSLPLLETCTVCVGSVSMEPSSVAVGKLTVGGCGRWIFTTRLLPKSAMKRSPALSTVTPMGFVIWAPFTVGERTIAGPPPAGSSTTRLLTASAMKRSPAPSTATPKE